MFYILVSKNEFLLTMNPELRNYIIIYNYTRIWFFQLGSFYLFLLYRGLWSTTEIIFFFNKLVINEMRTSSVSEGAKIEHINLRKLQNYTPKLNTSLLKEDCQNIPTPKFPNLWYIVHGLTFLMWVTIFQSCWDTGKYPRQTYT